MYATVRSYTGNELADALVQNESEVKRLISEIDGFKAYYLVRTGEGAASVSVYDDESGAQQSNRAAAEWLRENLPDVSGAAPTISAGEVVISF
jgi:4-diphosphocytidyl-2C-methyl-D-erythritol kinase